MCEPYFRKKKLIPSELDEKTREIGCYNFEEVAVEFSHKRLTKHAERILSVATIEIQNNVVLSEILEIIRQPRSSDDPQSRIRLARLAYEFTRSGNIGIIPDTLTKKQKSHLWRNLRFLGRPIHNCRLIAQIGLNFPQFRKIEIHHIPRPQPTKLQPEYIISFEDALRRLGLEECEQKLLSNSKYPVPTWSSFNSKSKEGLYAHAEVQLLAWHSANPHMKPFLDYFGCSKRTCLLCEALMRTHSPIILSRGRHGVCFPDWGIPHPLFVNSPSILITLEHYFVERIRHYVVGKGYNIYQNVAQSSFVSTLHSQELLAPRVREILIETHETEKSAYIENERAL